LKIFHFSIDGWKKILTKGKTDRIRPQFFKSFSQEYFIEKKKCWLLGGNQAKGDLGEMP